MWPCEVSSVIQRHFDAIARTDIDALIADGVIESKTLEYKQDLPGNSDADKKEFLADVSSFGNGSGGDIVYGIKAAVGTDGKKTGTPKTVRPITGTTADETKLRLEGMIRDGIDPRLRVQIKEIAGWGEYGQGFVILLRIPKSFASPHMVTYKGSSRFFSRHSAGKYPLDVGELRTAFLATESQAERIQRFCQDRLGKIMADETPVVLSSPRRLVLHLIPIASFLNNGRLDLSNEHLLLNGFPPIMGRQLDFRYNIDGFLTWISPFSCSYCQVFASGAVEAVGAGVVLGGGDKEEPAIAADYEDHVVTAVESYLEGYKSLGVIPPVMIAISLLGCKGSYLCLSRGMMRRVPHPIDRNAVMLPDVVIESLDVDVPKEMKPIFDAAWNACGLPRSYNYDNEGKWIQRR